MKHLLNIERIDELVKEFIGSIENVSYNMKVEKRAYLKKQFVISSEMGSAYLNCHIAKGRVSFDIQGRNENLKQICERCKQHIIEEATIPVPDRKCLKVVDVSEDNWHNFIEELKKEESYTIEEKPANPSASLKAFYSITDQYGAVIYLQYFSNRTVYAQGAISTLFIAFQTYLLGYLSSAPDSVTDTFLSIESIEDDVFSNDLSNYFHHPEYIQGTVIETLVRTSFTIANSACVLPDYGAMTFGIFKALEALLYLRLRKDIPTLDNFCCFNIDPATGARTFSVHTFDSNPPLKAALLHGYEFYCNNRHATFHVDPVLTTSRILDKETAIGLIVDTIDKMNDICDNW